jgi:hypothetical protein
VANYPATVIREAGGTSTVLIWSGAYVRRRANLREGRSVCAREALGKTHALPLGVVPLLTVAEAARFLGLSVRHLQDRADIPRVDVAAPGATKPAWRYRLADLDHFAASRLVNPYLGATTESAPVHPERRRASENGEDVM